MNPEMKQIGEMLQTKREELKLSLEEVKVATSIHISYLRAIEEGKIFEIISGVYAMGFTKQYLNYLGFDIDAIMKENPKAFQMQKESHEFSYGIGTLEMRGSLGGGVKWLPNILWAGAAAIMLVLAYYFAKAIGLL